MRQTELRFWACALIFFALFSGKAWTGEIGAKALPASLVGTAMKRQPTDRLIVKYRDVGLLHRSVDLSPLPENRLSSLRLRAAERGLVLVHLRNTALGAHVLKLDRSMREIELQALAEQLMADDPAIEYAEPDSMLKPAVVPDDSQYGKQWNLFESIGGIRASQAWELSTGAGVVVAVLDTGYRPHVDIVPHFASGYDFVSDAVGARDNNARDNDPRDQGDWQSSAECPDDPDQANSSWHGTHVAGIIAAMANNGIGVAGVAPGAKVQPVRVLGRCGGPISDITDGLVWASGGTVTGVPDNTTPARVVNLSLSGFSPSCSRTFQNAIDSARSRNTVVVVAAGNASRDVSEFQPANCNGVIVVSASDRDAQLAWYSNKGARVTLAAPGGNVANTEADGVYSTLNTGLTSPALDSYAYKQGTSMAAPHVAGTVALMLSKRPSLTPDEVTTILRNTARPWPNSACLNCGVGILDAYAAVRSITGGGTNAATGKENEPNNIILFANAISAPRTVSGTMASNADEDWFSVDIPSGRAFQAMLTPNPSGSYNLYVYNSWGALIGSSERGTGANNTVTIANNSGVSAKRYVRVKYWVGPTGSAGTYTLSLAW